MPMPRTIKQEQFSRAYVHAVAAAAGFQAERPTLDRDRLDLTICAEGPRGSVRSPKLDVQLKSTSIEGGSSEVISFELDADTYENLRHENYQVPRVLVVVVVPPDPADCLVQSQERLVLSKCGYWFT